MSLRKRIEKSETLANILAAVAGRYLGRCQRTITWEARGLEDLNAALAEGPILLVMWHSRCLMAAEHWPVADAPLSSLYNNSPVGRLAGALHRRVGLHPMEMSRRLSNRAASRTVLKRVREKVSIGMTGDGPIGPALEVQGAVLEWARVTGLPLFCYAYSTQRQKRMSSWDQMLVPRPYKNGAYVFRQFHETVPRKLAPEESEFWREEIRKFMETTTAEADAMVGLPPGP